MSELSSDARGAIERGFRVDGPSPERRDRVKGRVLVALGGGMAALGTVAGAAGAAGSAVAGGVTGAGVKSLLGSSLFVWFATGLGAGIGVGGVAAVVQHVQVGETVLHVAPVPAAKAPAPAPVAPAPQAAAGVPAAADPVTSPTVDPRSRDRSAPVAPSVTSEPGASAPEPPRVVPDPTSMSEEASLLQSAQRALSAGRAQAALSLLAEHELRFPSGALAEERRVAKVLALCALGRTEEASILARAFVVRSPRSVLIPRLETSCVGKSLVR